MGESLIFGVLQLLLFLIFVFLSLLPAALLGYEEVEGQAFNHIQELLTQLLLCSCLGLIEVKRATKQAFIKSLAWAKG